MVVGVSLVRDSCTWGGFAEQVESTAPCSLRYYPANLSDQWVSGLWAMEGEEEEKA